MAEDLELKRVLWFVLGGARGGENRARIIHALSQRPMNMNQLAEAMNVDYRTIMHHIQVLKSNSLVVAQGEKYGAVYFPSPRLQASMQIFEEVVTKLRFRIE